MKTHPHHSSDVFFMYISIHSAFLRHRASFANNILLMSQRLSNMFDNYMLYGVLLLFSKQIKYKQLWTSFNSFIILSK